MENKRDFIEFIKEARNDEALSKGFIEAKDVNELDAFFRNRGFDIDPQDTERIMELKEDMGLKAWPPPPHY